jgi:hypothetical protein
LEIFCDLCGNNINNINEKKIKINQSVIKLFRFINQKDWSVVGKVLIQEKDLRDIEKITQLALEGILDSKVF